MQTISILFEDEFLLAVNKPPRVLSVPASEAETKQSLPTILRNQFPHLDLFPLHRLDYGTSGVILFGKDQTQREKLESIFSARDTQKKYVALVMGIPKYASSTINKPLQARTQNRLIPAITHYQIEKKFPVPPTALVSCTIDTGRKHQIRKHLASIHHPIILDDLYGDKKFNRQFRQVMRLGRMFLHAQSIEFIHPIKGEKLLIEAPLTPDLLSILKKLNSVK